MSLAKRNCFGWYIKGQLDKNTRCMSDIKSVDVGTLSTVEDIKNLVHEGGLGVGPTETLYMQ